MKKVESGFNPIVRIPWNIRSFLLKLYCTPSHLTYPSRKEFNPAIKNADDAPMAIIGKKNFTLTLTSFFFLNLKLYYIKTRITIRWLLF